MLNLSADELNEFSKIRQSIVNLLIQQAKGIIEDKQAIGKPLSQKSQDLINLLEKLCSNEESSDTRSSGIEDAVERASLSTVAHALNAYLLDRQDNRKFHYGTLDAGIEVEVNLLFARVISRLATVFLRSHVKHSEISSEDFDNLNKIAIALELIGDETATLSCFESSF